MSSLPGPSTPSSRKRSKWDTKEEDEGTHGDDAVSETSTIKKRPKVKNVRVPERQQSPPPIIPERMTKTFSKYAPPRTAHPPLLPSRSVYSYERLNQIEEGTYGVVFRARDKQTGEVVALKKLKLDEEKYGFPITSLREINALITCKHENVVGIREIVVGETLTQCVRRCYLPNPHKRASHRAMHSSRRYIST
jgi:cell division cycle 2-like